MKSARLKKIISSDREFLFQNYGSRQEVCFIRGEGSILYDQDNREYIDFFSGIAVSNLGYNHPALSKALHRQVDSIMHSSNHYYNREQNEAASLISELAFPGKTLFSNSGTEANEAAIKLARRYGLSIDRERYQIISFKNGFHGRTMGSMTATAQEKIHAGFGPLPRGFKYLPFNDIEAFEKEIKKSKKTAAVILELIQGEGGIVVAGKSFVKKIFDICRKNDILVIVDEVQTGMGRTGTAFAFQQYGVSPDIITMAKGLGGGIPIGAMHAKNFLIEHLGQGTHGSTFGGNHLACAAAKIMLKELKKKNIYSNIEKTSRYITERLQLLKEKKSIVKEVRGLGLHIGFEIASGGPDLVKKALASGLIINCTAGSIIRIMPPLTIPLSIVKQGMSILEDLLLQAGE